MIQPVSLFRHILFFISPIVPVFSCVWEDAGVYDRAVIMRNVQILQILQESSLVFDFQHGLLMLYRGNLYSRLVLIFA